MKTNLLVKLETPPPELAARVMGAAREWREPERVGWLIGSQAMVLAALLLVSSATLPEQLASTAEDLRVWGDALAQATLDVSDNMGRLIGLDFQGELL
ncbi:MAG: hypothetical protein HZA91_17985 [Verrucomicrobia bacterium]|nr:hypothetical protein [Verrucomicrobiota bacterium]